MAGLRASYAAAALAAAVALAGCGAADPEPNFADPTSSATLRTPTPADPTDSATSAASDRLVERQFINDYFASVTLALGTGRSESFLRLSAPGCRSCQVIANNVDKAFADGGYVRGGSWDVVEAQYIKTNDSLRIWSVEVTTARENWFDGNDHPVKIVRPATVQMQLSLATDGSDLVLSELQLT